MRRGDRVELHLRTGTFEAEVTMVSEDGNVVHVARPKGETRYELDPNHRFVRKADGRWYHPTLDAWLVPL
jgi:hypothetical protein